MRRRESITEWDRNGKDIVFRAGCRITWTHSVLGLGGVTISGTFVNAADTGGGGYIARIDAKPSDSLRALADQYRNSTDPDKWPTEIHGLSWPDGYAGKGLDGNGGSFIVTREEFRRAVAEGHLTLDPLPDDDRPEEG